MQLSLGAKLSLTSTLLVTGLVAFLGYFNASEIGEVHNARAAQEQQTFEDQALARAEGIAHVLSVTVREALVGTELNHLASVVRELVAREPSVRYMRIADHTGSVLADSSRPVVAGAFRTLSLQAAQETSTQQRDYQGQRVLEVTRPITSGTNADEIKLHGVLVFGYDLAPLQTRLQHIEEQRQGRVQRSLRSSLIFGAIALVLGVVLGLFQAMRFTRPIRRLAATALRIAEGDLDARVDVQRKDEVGALGRQFNQMADKVQELVAESIAKVALEHELSLARQLQSTLVPSEGIHSAPGLQVAGYYEPASTCGGDFWDFSVLPRGLSALVVGDVTGHGVPAAMLTATAKACLDTLRHLQGENLQVAEMLRVLDRVIRDSGQGSYFMTAAVAIHDAYQNTLFFSSAGHPPAFLLRWNQDGINLTRLIARGNRLGDGDETGFEARRVRVARGDVLVWYTDGFTEAVDADNRPFGTRRLLRALSCLDPQGSPEDAVALIVDQFTRFRGQQTLDDDITLVVGRVQ